MNPITKIKSVSDNRLGKVSLSSRIENPKRDWGILIVFFFILILISVGFDMYMYQKIVSGDMYISVKREELVIESLKSKDLQKILENFQAKKSAITTLKVESMVDPSL